MSNLQLNNDRPLSQHVTEALDKYFASLEGEKPSDVYQLVISQVEKPLVEYVLKQNQYNQSKTADMLGMNRNTLRKKIQQYHIEIHN